MSVVDWKYRLLRGGVDLMRWSRDLALIAGVRTYGLLTRREGDDGRAEWGTLTADLSSDDSSCLVVSPCLVVTDGTDSLSVSYQAGEAVIGTTTAAPVRVATNAGALVIEDAASGGDVTLSCSGDVTVDADGTSIALASSGHAWTLTQGAQSLAWGGVLAGSTWQLLSSRALNLKSAATFPVRVLAGSGSHVLVGHDGDSTGLPVAQVERYNVLDNQTISSATKAAIPGLTAPVRANYRYRVEVFLTHQRASATGTLTVGFTTPSGAQGRYRVEGAGSSATGDSPGWSTDVSAPSSTTRRYTYIDGYLITDAAGTFEVQAARDATNHTVYNGAWMRVSPQAQVGV